MVENYKSIASCDLELGPLTILVGRNGAGKSNLVDALRFVRDAMVDPQSVGGAISKHGYSRIPHAGGGSSCPSPAWRIEAGAGTYRFSLNVRRSDFDVVGEHALIDADPRTRTIEFGTDGEHVARWDEAQLGPRPTWNIAGRLLLSSLAGHAAFGDLWNALGRISFYRITSEAMRGMQPRSSLPLLDPSGSNFATTVHWLQTTEPRQLERIRWYLRSLDVPIVALRAVDYAGRMTVQFELENVNIEPPLGAAEMSDGTLQALGILLALLGPRDHPEAPGLIVIEEPETALHPAAMGVLMDAALDATHRGKQVIFTTHSPDLLDHPEVTPDMIVVVTNEGGTTKAGRLLPAQRELIQKHLTTPGELLRLDQMAGAHGPPGKATPSC